MATREELMSAIEAYAKSKSEFEVWKLYQPTASKRVIPAHWALLTKINELLDEVYHA